MSSRCKQCILFQNYYFHLHNISSFTQNCKTQNCSHKSALLKRRNWCATNDCQRLHFFLLPVIIEAKIRRQSNKQLKLRIKVTYSIHHKLPLYRKLTPFFTLHQCDQYILLQTKLYKHNIFFLISSTMSCTISLQVNLQGFDSFFM